MVHVTVTTKEGVWEGDTKTTTEKGIFTFLKKNHEAITDTTKNYIPIDPAKIEVTDAATGRILADGKYICDVFLGRVNLEIHFKKYYVNNVLY